MKVSFVSLFAVAGLFTTAWTSPVVEKRDEAARVAAAYPIFQGLFAEVQQYTGAINKTTASITPESSIADRAAAAASVQDALRSITAAVTGATPKLDALQSIPAEKRSLVARQSDGALANLVANLILDISGALNNIVNTLGLGAILGSLGLGPLLSSLSGLLISLRNLLDQVLLLVKSLVDQLLTGLATGIIGIFP